MEDKNIFARINEITPVEEYETGSGKILLKRDDKFSCGYVNGGKLRQAIYLIGKNLEAIRDRNGGVVVSASSIKSPQSAIISTVCNRYGLSCRVVTYKTGEKNINLTIAQKEGAKIYGTKSGYTSVIESFARRNFSNAFFTNMGFASNEIIDANVGQVANIPLNLDYLVIPVGSAMNFISIIKGLDKYKNNVQKIVGVYVGKEPFKTVDKYIPKVFGTRLGYDVTLVKYDKPYSTWVNVNNNFFDPIYEAKAYDWIINNLDVANSRILLWVVGRRNLEMEPENITYNEVNVRRLA